MAAGKHFTQEKNCDKIVFGYDDIVGRGSDHPGSERLRQLQRSGYSPESFWLEQPGVLIVVEGEMDKLACNEARPDASRHRGGLCW